MCTTVKHTHAMLLQHSVVQSSWPHQAGGMCCVCVCVHRYGYSVCVGFTFYIPVRLPHMMHLYHTAYQVAHVLFMLLICHMLTYSVYTHTPTLYTCVYYIHVYCTCMQRHVYTRIDISVSDIVGLSDSSRAPYLLSETHPCPAVCSGCCTLQLYACTNTRVHVRAVFSLQL